MRNLILKWFHGVCLFQQTMDRLKRLLDDIGVTYSEMSFASEKGVAGLGANPFVSYRCITSAMDVSGFNHNARGQSDLNWIYPYLCHIGATGCSYIYLL